MIFQNFINFNIFLIIFNLNSYNCELKEKITVGEYLSAKIIVMERFINKADLKPRDGKHVICKSNGYLNCSKLQTPKLIQTESFVFLLSGIELSQIEMTESGEKKLKFIGHFDGIENDTDIQDVHAGEWQSYIVVVVILTDHIIIYVTKNEYNEFYLQPRERIRIKHKPYIQFLNNYNTSNNDLNFLLVNKLNDDLGEIIQYKWRLTHFTSDYHLNVLSMDETYIFQDYDCTIIVVTNYKHNIIEIYNNNNNNASNYKKIQKIMLNTNAIDTKLNYYTLNYNEHYFLLCPTKINNLCKLYKYFNNTELFINIKKLPYNYQKLNKLYYNHNFANLLITTNINNNKLIIFNNYNLYDYNLIECSNIDDIRNIIIYNNFNRITIIILNGENKINFINIEIIKNNNTSGSYDDSTSDGGGDTQLLLKTINCFKNLNNLISSKQTVIDQINVKKQNVLQKNKNMKVQKILGHNLSITNSNNTINTIKIQQNLEINLIQLYRTIIKINSTRTAIKNHRVKRSNIVKNLIVKSLNKTNLLLKNTNNIIKNNVFVKNNLVLHKNLYLNNSMINNINLTNLYLKNDDATQQNGGVIKLHDLKIFSNLIINSMNVNYLNNISAQNLFSGDGDNFNNSNISIIGSYGVENLIVENLNGVNWNEFYRNVYQTDSKRVIHGNLTFTTPFAVKNLKVNKLNNISTNNYLNKFTNQTISANIYINKFYANLIKANTINNLEFSEKTIFLLNKSDIINGDLLIPKLKIRNNLFLSSTAATALLKTHYNASKDLTQIYNKIVTINGNLFINKLFLENANYSKIIVNNREFNIKQIKSEYWLKNLKQKINKFIFNSEVVTTQLFIEQKLNDYDINKYCQNSFETNLNYKNNFYFTNLHVEGNINLNNSVNQQFLLNDIINNCILLNSDSNKIINIVDRKQINNLIVNKIHVNHINNYTISNFVLNQTNLRVHTLKIRKLNYLNNKKILVGRTLTIQNYRDFFKNAIYINKNYNITEIKFKNNLKINKLYSSDFKLNQIYNDSINYNLDNLKIIINGDVLFKQHLQVNTINSVANVKTYFNLLVFKNERNLQIGGTKLFWDHVTVHHNLLTEHQVNGINLNYLLGHLFLNNVDQLIQPIWQFTNITTAYLKTRYLNDVNTTLFLQQDYDNQLDIIINSDLIINNLTTKNRIYGNTKLNIPNIINLVQNPIRNAWKFINISKNLYYPVTNRSTKLSNLFYNSVVRNQNQIITNDIIFSDSVQIVNLKFNKLINSAINLTSIINDSLIRNDRGDNNIIYGRKYFKNILFIQNNYTIRNYLNCNYINNINIVQFNDNVSRWDHIKNVKQFKNFIQINKLFVNNEILKYNKNINDMVTVDGTKLNNVILNLHDINVKNNLNFIKINNFNISDFLETRIKLDATETQTIDRLNINGDFIINSECTIKSINGVNMSELVYKNEPTLVVGKKTFLQNLIFNTSVNIAKINNIDIKSMNEHTIFLNRPESLREIRLPEVVVRSGLLMSSDSQIMVPPHNYNITTNSFKLNLTNLNTYLDTLKTLSYYQKLNYFDYTKKFDITINNYNTNNNNYNIWIDSYDSGVYCSLTENCYCPFQYLINVKQFNRIAINKNPYFNRIFSLNNDFVNITIETKYETDQNCASHDYSYYTNITTVTLTSNMNTEYGSKRIYQLNEIVKNVKLFEYGKTMAELNSFIVILNTNPIMYNNTITLVKIVNNNMSDVKLQQTITNNGHDVNMNLFTWNIGVLLIVTSIYKTTYYNNGFVELYLFNKNEHSFDLVQKFIGHYDLVNGAAVKNDNSYMILLAKQNKNYINVYKLVAGKFSADIKFDLYQKIMFEKKIKSITVFEHLENMLFSVTMENDHYFIYIYKFIEGWIVHSTGYYNHVEHIESFKIQNKDYLFVNGRLSPTAIAIYTQGN